MESIKSPETVITLINTAALLGASIYFYRKINNLELELNKHSEHLTATVKKVKEYSIYKTHIEKLGKAIKDVNNALGSSNRDVEALKEIVKFQATQITELQAIIGKLDTENKNEIKLKENMFLRSIAPPPQYYGQSYPPQGQFQTPQARRQQPVNQQFPQQGRQQMPQQFPQNPQEQFPQQVRQQIPQQGQQFGQQGRQQMPQQQFAQQAQQYPTQQSQQYPTQQSQQYPTQQSQQYPTQQGQQYGRQSELLDFDFSDQNQNQYSEENFEDEDAAIAAVRQARQQVDDPLGLNF